MFIHLLRVQISFLLAPFPLRTSFLCNCSPAFHLSIDPFSLSHFSPPLHSPFSLSLSFAISSPFPCISQQQMPTRSSCLLITAILPIFAIHWFDFGCFLKLRILSEKVLVLDKETSVWCKFTINLATVIWRDDETYRFPHTFVLLFSPRCL